MQEKTMRSEAEHALLHFEAEHALLLLSKIAFVMEQIAVGCYPKLLGA